MKNQSLQDQLLKAGLVSETKAKQARAEKRKENKKRRSEKGDAADAAKQSLQENRVRQAEKDRQLNEQRRQEAERRQIVNQIRQLIENNRVETGSGGENDIAYHFNDGNKVKTLYLDSVVRDKVIAGKLAIVRAEKKYDVVPADVAGRIRACDAEAVVVMFSEQPETSAEDEYADYQIPDDLMW